jgi:hypothetical protein
LVCDKKSPAQKRAGLFDLTPECRCAPKGKTFFSLLAPTIAASGVPFDDGLAHHDHTLLAIKEISWSDLLAAHAHSRGFERTWYCFKLMLAYLYLLSIEFDIFFSFF